MGIILSNLHAKQIRMGLLVLKVLQSIYYSSTKTSIWINICNNFNFVTRHWPGKTCLVMFKLLFCFPNFISFSSKAGLIEVSSYNDETSLVIPFHLSFRNQICIQSIPSFIIIWSKKSVLNIRFIDWTFEKRYSTSCVTVPSKLSKYHFLTMSVFIFYTHCIN